MQNNELRAEQFAVRGFGEKDVFPWEVIDHGIDRGFLWREYLKSFRGEATGPCKTDSCRLCGVCREG
jgi:hypothetical protein